MKTRTRALLYATRNIADLMEYRAYNNYVCNRLEADERPGRQEALKLFMSLYQTTANGYEHGFTYNGVWRPTFNGASDHDYPSS